MAIKIVPTWLKPGLQIDAVERERLTTLCANWLKLHAAMPDLTEMDILKCMVIEYQTYQRPVIIGRLKTRFDRLRSLRENAELFRVEL